MILYASKISDNLMGFHEEVYLHFLNILFISNCHLLAKKMQLSFFIRNVNQEVLNLTVLKPLEPL